jgi:hypothetical protein
MRQVRRSLLAKDPPVTAVLRAVPAEIPDDRFLRVLYCQIHTRWENSGLFRRSWAASGASTTPSRSKGRGFTMPGALSQPSRPDRAWPFSPPSPSSRRASSNGGSDEIFQAARAPVLPSMVDGMTFKVTGIASRCGDSPALHDGTLMGASGAPDAGPASQDMI